MSDRESMAYDVVIVGAGPAGLSAAIRLKQLASEAGCELARRLSRPSATLTFRLHQQSPPSPYTNSTTGARSSRMYMGRPLVLANVCDGSIPIAW